MTAKIQPLKALSKDDILNADDRVTEWVDVPEWGGRVLVRSLEGMERDRFEGASTNYTRDEKGKLVLDKPNTENVRARLCAMTMIDEESGYNLFSERDVLVLGHKSAAGLDRVFTVAMKLSKITDEDIAELVGDLGKDQNGASGSDSPETSA
jgi:hypothetical protein